MAQLETLLDAVQRDPKSLAIICAGEPPVGLPCHAYSLRIPSLSLIGYMELPLVQRHSSCKRSATGHCQLSSRVVHACACAV